MDKLVMLSVIENLVHDNVASQIIISIAVMLFAGFAMTRITKLLKLPNVTAYILVGIILGPFVLNVVPTDIIEGTSFLSDIALAFIAFSTGEFFKLKSLKENGGKVIIITILEAVLASVLIFILTFFILKLSLAFSLVISSLASATAPASTMMTIKQTKAKGDFVNTLLMVIAIDDIVCLLLYSICISVANVINVPGEEMHVFNDIIAPLLKNIGAILAGGLFGVMLKLLMPESRTTDNKLIIGVGMLFAFCGLCLIIDTSPLLGCMAMGMVFINIGGDEKFFRQLAYFSPPILLLFFVRSGLNFKVNTLVATEGVGALGIPLFVVAILYFVIRIVGKYFGAFLGCVVTKKDKKVRNYLGLALVPQAGVAIGLAALGARTLGGTMGNDLETIILASSVLYELIGPSLAKLSLYLSKSYSNDIEELTDVAVVDESGKKKTDVEILIDRINEIKATLPEHEEISPEEAAFTEASIEMYNSYNELHNHKGKWRNK